jgi:glycosyltransferase involved in cell wall biosynthesis
MDVSAAWRLSRLVRSERPEIVHAHDPHAVAMASWALSLSADRTVPPLVASRRVDFPLRTTALSRWKHRQVRMFICASEMIRQLLLSQGVPAERTVTVHEGIDLAHVAAAPPLDVHTEFHLPHGAPVVVNIAALAPHKGQRHLVDAVPAVLRVEPDTRFLIVGEGELLPSLRKQVRQHALERHVILTGFRHDALSLLKGADLFVMSSVTEGLGTSLLDAMACSKPIVATRVGGIPEVVADGETGLLVPERDPVALASAIVELLRHPERREAFGAAGLARVTERFSVGRMVDQTLEVYARVAGRAP